MHVSSLQLRPCIAVLDIAIRLTLSDRSTSDMLWLIEWLFTPTKARQLAKKHGRPSPPLRIRGGTGFDCAECAGKGDDFSYCGGCCGGDQGDLTRRETQQLRELGVDVDGARQRSESQL